MRRIYIDPAQASRPAPLITGGDANHIRNALRLGPGDPVTLFDGAGREYRAHIRDVSHEGVRVEILETLETLGESPARIAAAQAFLKDRKMDALIRRLTELGISQWLPFFSERSVARPDDRKIAARMERWEKIARESLKQCRRSRTPEIRFLPTLDAVLGLGREYDLRILFWENKGQDATLADLPIPIRGAACRRILLVLGPEGGFSGAEAKAAARHGFFIAGLGPRILRAETAAVAACALVQYMFGDMGNMDVAERTTE